MVRRVTHSISGFPAISMGCKPVDGGNLILDKQKMENLISEYPSSTKWIKKMLSGADFIKGNIRFCLWITDEEKDEAMKIPTINKRIQKTIAMRLNSSDAGARKLAERPHQFREFNACSDTTLIIPSTSSSNREYIPMGYGDNNLIVNNAMYMVNEAPLWVFGVITSKMHMAWVNTIGGKLKMDYRYTNLCYNTFPFPKIGATQKKEIEEAAENVLITREYHLGKTLADLYDPDLMPDDLREAHRKLDDLVDRCYPGYPFANDEARLECLFKLYEKLINMK